MQQTFFKCHNTKKELNLFASRLHGLDATLCHASVVRAATRPPPSAVYRPYRNSPVLQRNRPYRYTTPQFCSLSGPSGWSVRYDRYGSIYTTIYLHDIYSDAHTVDTSIVHTHSKVDSSLQPVFLRRPQWNVLPTVRPITRSARPPTITWPRVNFKTMVRFDGSQD